MNSKIALKQLKALEKYTDSSLRLAAEWNEHWKILIATILSAQTRDEKTIEICEILFRKFGSVEKLAKADLREIRKVIRPINYYKTKSKNIKKTARMIIDGIPKDIEGLLELPGVGRKVANVYLVEAFKAEAIGVDTHVARISRKLGWTKNKDKHKIEKDLEKLFPRKYWNSINYILVRFGRKNRREEDEIFKRIKHQT